jgi:hypothetical protein
MYILFDYNLRADCLFLHFVLNSSYAKFFITVAQKSFEEAKPSFESGSSILGTSYGPNGFEEPVGMIQSLLNQVLAWYRAKVPYHQQDTDFEQAIRRFHQLTLVQLGVDKAFRLEPPIQPISSDSFPTENAEVSVTPGSSPVPAQLGVQANTDLPFRRARDFLDKIVLCRCPSQFLHHFTSFFELVDYEVSCVCITFGACCLISFLVACCVCYEY